jgi:trimethylamine--corrinoid protein Co-methyltransferase
MTERSSRRSGGRDARIAARQTADSSRVVRPGLMGGQYRPLSDHDVERIHSAALTVLAEIGMADAPPALRTLALEHGCSLDPAGRLLFPRMLVEDVIAKAAREFWVYGRTDSRYDVQVGGQRVHFATAGEAVTVLDLKQRRYRPSTLLDLYDFARLVDRLEHVHQFGQTVVATEIADPLAHAASIAYACLSGTAKTFGISIGQAEHVAPIVELFDMAMGGEGRFAKRPFAVIGCCPIVSPLRFAEDSTAVLMETTRLGLIGDVAIAAQAGATAPAALAGTLVQTVAETLATVMVVNLVRPGHPTTFGIWPFVSDLRTGSFTGGGGEEAILSAAAMQIASYYDLPASVGAGMTDSKLPDNQAGFEKGVSVAMAALAGGNYVCECAGMLASLMGCSFEAMVIDNDMLGMVQRSLRGIEVNDETLSLAAIRQVVDGQGHFLGSDQTLELMQTEYLYPEIADRRSASVWAEAGGRDVLEAAHERVHQILGSHYPNYLAGPTDAAIRERFPVRLAPSDMQAACRRW